MWCLHLHSIYQTFNARANCRKQMYSSVRVLKCCRAKCGMSLLPRVSIEITHSFTLLCWTIAKCQEITCKVCWTLEVLNKIQLYTLHWIEDIFEVCQYVNSWQICSNSVAVQMAPLWVWMYSWSPWQCLLTKFHWLWYFLLTLVRSDFDNSTNCIDL